MIEKHLKRNESLAPYTTLELGGPAEYFIEVHTREALLEALAFANEQQLKITIISGGSNVVIADEGVRGLVVRVKTSGSEWTKSTTGFDLAVEAGEPWDALVAEAVTRNLSGIECLSGIPGSVGATPIQNVGAYGQEVSQTIASVEVCDRQTLQSKTLSAADCEFAYRQSLLRRAPDRYVVLAVHFHFHQGPPALRYGELETALKENRLLPTPSNIRETVLRLRRTKSMVLDETDENRRSVGSFFLNAVLDEETYDNLLEAWRISGVLKGSEAVPTFPFGAGLRKIPAAWLIEKAGFGKGLRKGPVGISSRHSLALVHHGQGSTAQLISLAAEIRQKVEERLHIRLEIEPTLIGSGLHL